MTFCSPIPQKTECVKLRFVLHLTRKWHNPDHQGRELEFTVTNIASLDFRRFLESDLRTEQRLVIESKISPKHHLGDA